MRILLIIDSVGGPPAYWIVNRLFGITGWSNFKLARVILVVGMVSMTLHYAFNNDGRHPAWAPFFLLVWGYNFYSACREIDKLEKIFGDRDIPEIMPIEGYTALMSVLVARTLWFIVAVFFMPWDILLIFSGHNGWSDSLFFFAALILMSLALYASTYFYGGGKTVWAKAWDRIRAIEMPKITAPAPAPVTVGLRRSHGIGGRTY